jgi:hypothetical protein
MPLRYAVIGDIHANLEALAAVLADASEQRCILHAFLGTLLDIVLILKPASTLCAL